MPLTTGALRFVRATVAGVGLLILASPSIPVAQAPAQNGKQRLLAGERLDPQLLATIAERRAATRAMAPVAPDGTPVPPARPAVAPGLLVVKFAGDVESSRVSALAGDVGASRVVAGRHGDFTVLHVDPAADVQALARSLAAQPGVIYAEPAAMRYPLYRPNDELYDLQWNLQALEMERAWDINRGGKDSIVVAVIDGGVAYLTRGSFHQAPDLAGTRFVPGYDFLWQDAEPVDLEGHGTHVTGTIAQTTGNGEGVAGMAFGVSIMPIKAVSGELDVLLGAPVVGTSAVVADAIRFAVDNGAHVINMSLGGDMASTAERDAIRYAVDQGVVVVVAAGNEGERGSPPSYPGADAGDIDGAIAVGAVDVALARAPYSNVNDYVEIAAPGGDLGADLNDDGYADGVLQQTLDAEAVFGEGRWDVFVYEFSHGTSMATPHVAALAALLIDQGITDPRAVEAALKRFATDLGPEGRDNETGHGLLNPRATLRGLGLSR